MHHASFKTFPYLLAVALLFYFETGNCQIKPRTDNINVDSLKKAGLSISDSISVTSLETMISEKEKLTQTRQALEVLKQKAIAIKDDITLARCLSALMKIKDQRTEDSLYFRNSAFMDTLLSSPDASPALKAIIHILHAQRLSSFNYRSLKFNHAAYRTKNLKYNYAALTVNQRDSIAANDIDAALLGHPINGTVKQLLWLSSNPDVFLFEPKFEDIVLSERVNLAANKYYNYQSDRSLNQCISLPSVKFRKLLDSIANSQRSRMSVLGGYQRW
ncbi:MAG TPA: hypothetical protein VGI43_06430, partial [Mucilaginibacter sp.]